MRPVSAHGNYICVMGRIWRGTSSPYLRNHFRLEALSSRKDTWRQKRIAGIEAGKVLR